jgi:hypothetical protein
LLFFFGFGVPTLFVAGACYMHIHQGAVDEANRDMSLLNEAIIDNGNIAVAVEESLGEIGRKVKALNICSQVTQEQQKEEESQYQRAVDGNMKSAKGTEYKGHRKQEFQGSGVQNKEHKRCIERLKEQNQDLHKVVNIFQKLQEELKVARIELERTNMELQNLADMACDRQKRIQADLEAAKKIRDQKPSRNCLQQFWADITGRQ